MSFSLGVFLRRASVELGAFSFDSLFSRCIHSTCPSCTGNIAAANTLTHIAVGPQNHLSNDLSFPRVAIAVLVGRAVLGREATEASGVLDDARRASSNVSKGCRSCW